MYSLRSLRATASRRASRIAPPALCLAAWLLVAPFAMAAEPDPRAAAAQTPGAAAIERRFDEMDANHDGVVSRDEVRGFTEARKKQREARERVREDREQRLRERVNRADVDRDGAVTRAEARQRMPRVYQHFDEIDTDRDGSVTSEEIRAFWRKRALERRFEEGGRDPRL